MFKPDRNSRINFNFSQNHADRTDALREFLIRTIVAGSEVSGNNK
jgi:hypothetical protein